MHLPAFSPLVNCNAILICWMCDLKIWVNGSTKAYWTNSHGHCCNFLILFYCIKSTCNFYNYSECYLLRTASMSGLECWFGLKLTWHYFKTFHWWVSYIASRLDFTQFRFVSLLTFFSGGSSFGYVRFSKFDCSLCEMLLIYYCLLTGGMLATSQRKFNKFQSSIQTHKRPFYFWSGEWICSRCSGKWSKGRENWGQGN